MSICCPHCGGTGVANGTAVADVERLRQACRELDIPVAWDNTIDEPSAARILHRKALTLKGWRQGRSSFVLRYVMTGNRARYRLDDLAAFIAKAENVFDEP